MFPQSVLLTMTVDYEEYHHNKYLYLRFSVKTVVYACLDVDEI